MRKILFFAAFMLCTMCPYIAGAAPEVPGDVYKWVQSSARQDYYYNVQQICFVRNADGTVDTNRVTVPVLKIYDELMIHDVVSKRRWNGKSLSGFDDLVGVAEYLEFDIKSASVNVRQVDYLDSTLTTIEECNLQQTIDLKSLSPMSFDAKFYNAILDYAQRNQLELAERASSKLDARFKARVLAAQKEYIAKHKATSAGTGA
ncbi:MAG: hypothetical protein K6C05_10180 [Anaerovibrio sp.]|uniref:hypothetical protein n=1 Tax=Anaerovibrio sp. TaxID=1872532 RepID=UPI0025FFCE65|nr:hypothetical protein [Anaerovibrio sp.]MCR5177196.1 hypothetical protein [Anaerovibrio sp.]